MMIIQPRVKGFICVVAHPDGCYRNIEDQIAQLKHNAPLPKQFKKVLIIGGSTGYGLASRIVASFAMGSQTLNVALERPPRPGRTASAGWYHTLALEELATKRGLFAQTLNADAFQRETKERVGEIIRKKWGGIDLLIYSLAAPKRLDAVKNVTYISALKPIGTAFTTKTVNVTTRAVSPITLPAATPSEIEATVKVMGGEDWKAWIEYLMEKELLNKNFKTLAYSYVGSDLTEAIYRKGTIGQAKKHLEATALEINQLLVPPSPIAGAAAIAVNKALVTQASAAIPVLPLYVAILYRVMKQQNVHENTLQQMERLFQQLGHHEAASGDFPTWFRLDDYELHEKVQRKVQQHWDAINTNNLTHLADIEGYWNEFLNLFGFARTDIDYAQSVEENRLLNLLS